MAIMINFMLTWFTHRGSWVKRSTCSKSSRKWSLLESSTGSEVPGTAIKAQEVRRPAGGSTLGVDQECLVEFEKETLLNLY